MKHTLMGLISASLLIGLLWYTFGGLALVVTMLSLVLITLLIGAFSLGSWWSSQLLERGANIALKAQTGDNRREASQINALAGLMKETLKLGGGLNQAPPYPSLPFGEETVEASFTIAGLEDET